MRRRFDCPDHFVPSLEHSRNVIARWERERAAGQRFPFAVREASIGTLTGGCELRPLGAKSANVSYWTYPAHRRRGIASRAVALLRELAFVEFEFNRLEIVADADNVGSRRVALYNGLIEVGMREGKVLYVRDRG
jgi:RimJ/RimL family protein N-acetyltransferase